MAIEVERRNTSNKTSQKIAHKSTKFGQKNIKCTGQKGIF